MGEETEGRSPDVPADIVLNVLWILTGGVWMALGWLIATVIMAITIIGLPWARAAFNIAIYTFLPFGHVALPRDEVRQPGGSRHRPIRGDRQRDLARARRLVAGARPPDHRRGLAITLIGIPFAWAHLKLAGISLWPVGKTIVTREEANLCVRAPWLADIVRKRRRRRPERGWPHLRFARSLVRAAPGRGLAAHLAAGGALSRLHFRLTGAPCPNGVPPGNNGASAMSVGAALGAKQVGAVAHDLRQSR